MKRLFLTLFTVLLSFLGISQTKRALTIFIGKYAELEGKGWGNISSINDSSLILPTLRKQGFSSQNVQILCNEKATSENIHVAFSDLITKTKLNDIVVIHISSHGEQIEDDNQDETDGLDESIVTYNAIAPRWFKEDKALNYDKEIKHYFRDDDLGNYIDAIRKNAGPKGEVLVIMDYCHSGSGTRDVSNHVRGGEPAIMRRETKKTVQDDNTVTVDQFSDEKTLAPFVVISASRADELNKEVKLQNGNFGSLSYAVSKAFNHLSTNSTYQGFYTEIQSEMNLIVPNQHPVIEGNAQNKKLWKGEFLVKPQFFTISSAQFVDQLKIDAGITSGLTVGTTVYLYPSDTYDTTKALLFCRGKISAVSNFQATVVPEKPVNSENYWVFVKDIFFPLEKFSVKFERVSEEKRTLFEGALSKISVVDQSAPVKLLVTTINGKEVLVNTINNYAIDTLSSSTDQIAFERLVQRFIKAESMRKLIVNETTGYYSIELLPFDKVKKIVDTTINLKKNGITSIQAETSVVVQFTNNNSRDIYFNILDIEPTEKINAIMPNAKAKGHAITKEDLLVKAGETKIFSQFPINITKPFGDEVFKIYVDIQPFDLQHLASEGTRDIRAVNKNEAVLNYNFIITK
ncbi:MAG: caspase family protein [Bacteroidota bacterium]